MDYISLPEKCLKLELRKNFHSSFHINNENVLVQPIKNYIKYILNQLNKNKSKKNRAGFIPSLEIERNWLSYFYKIIEKKESTFTSRFLGKEFIYRRLLLRTLFPQKGVIEKDFFIDNLIKDKDYPYVAEVVSIIENNKNNIIFIRNRCKSIKRDTKLTLLGFYQRMLITFPFELESYKFWINNILLYNVHKEIFSA